MSGLQSMRCENCSAPIRSQDIDRPTGLVTCSFCGSMYQLPNIGQTDKLSANKVLTALLVNGSFDEPRLTESVEQIHHDDVPGWLTTASDQRIKMWRSGHDGVPSYEGEQHIELNGSGCYSIYQDFETPPGQVLYWRFAHRGRSGVDTVALELGQVGQLPNLIEEFATGKEWRVYEGSYRVPSGQKRTRIEFRCISVAAERKSAGNFLDAVSVEAKL